MRRGTVAALVLLLVTAAFAPVRGWPHAAQTPAEQPTSTGVREAAWSPDGRRLAATWFDAIWTMNLEGRDQKRVAAAPRTWAAERDPAWSADGKWIAFAALTNGQFDVWIAPSGGGVARQLTATPGDERWPSFLSDGRVLFSQRPAGAGWRVMAIAGDGRGEPAAISPGPAAEWQARVSPNGQWIAFVSDREPEANNDADIFVREFGSASAQPRLVRLTRGAGVESHPTWAPDSARIAFAAGRPGANGIYVSAISGASAPATSANSVTSTETLASRRLGIPAWSPDGEQLAIATFSVTNAGYNGNPDRNDNDPPTSMAGTNQFALWRVLAPRAVDAGATSIHVASPDSARWQAAFDQVWHTLKGMYYGSGPSADAWEALRTKYRPQMAAVKDLAGAEAVIDAMIAEQPLIKPSPGFGRAVVASGHPLASAAGAAVIERGGNVIDAGIATAFALGVVEPDASGLGGDGQAILFLRGMSEPVVIEYKDMTPSRIAPDNPRLFTPTGGRVASDGPSVANIPGIVAGLDLLYQKYGSRKVAWADLIAPAIKLADEGYILDEALPTTIAEGQASFRKYPEAAKIFLPNGRVPRAGDRFVNKDYAETLRILAKEGGDSFYRGSIARRISDDMAANGGVITFEDLAQYRAIERKPLVGRYHGHLVYSVPAPVSNGLQMIETLQILDQYKPGARASYATDPDFLHYAIEAWRARDGGARIADPERWPVDYGNHLDPAHAIERFKTIDPAKARSGGAGRGGIVEGQPGDEADRRVQTGTTAFVVADADGNMIAFTQTLSTWGGNYYVSKGLGFLYNDHFRGGAGRGGAFGSTLPLMRSSTTSVPTLVFTAPAAGATGPGTPRLATGAAGNAWIPASVYNVILNVIDAGMGAQAAIEAPRMLIGGGGGGRSNIQIEDRIARHILANLEARGHAFTKVGRKGEVKYGYAAVAVVDPATGRAEGGAEPRRSHAVAVVK